MALTLKNLAGKPRTVEVTWEEETAQVTFLPGKMTPEFLDELRATEESQGDKAVVAILSECLVTWELENEDGSPVGTDIHTLRQLPLPFLAHVLNHLQGDMGPTGEASGSFGE